MGQIIPTASLHRDHSILYALVCEKEISRMGKNNGNPNLVCELKLLRKVPFSCCCFVRLYRLWREILSTRDMKHVNLVDTVYILTLGQSYVLRTRISGQWHHQN